MWFLTKLIRLGLALIFTITCLTSSFAHGPVHEQIKQLSSAINQSPDSLLLYIERGMYYQVDEDFPNAIADFQKVLSLDNSTYSVHFPLAEIYFQQKDYRQARQYIHSYLPHFPQHAKGQALSGKIHLALGEDSLAIQGFEKVIEIKKQNAAPEDFIQLALLLKKNNPEKAYQVLSQGNNILGSLVSLQTELITIANEQQWYDRSIQTIDTILLQASRKESWLIQKAEVLIAQGHLAEAKIIYQNAQAEINGLKPKIKSTEYTQSLQSKIDFALSELK